MFNGRRNTQSVGVVMLRLRKSCGLTLRQAGAATQMHFTAIRNLEGGERRIDVFEFVKLCWAYGADPLVVFSGLTMDLLEMARTAKKGADQ